MNLNIIFFGVLSGFVLLQWWALPQTEAAWAANRTLEKLAKAGVVAALRAARTVLQIATLVYGALLAGIWIFDVVGDPVGAVALQAKIEFLAQMREPLSFVKDSIIANIVFWVALLGLAYLLYKRQHADLGARVTERVQSEVERLKSELDRGEWVPLPPTKEMVQIGSQIDQLNSYLTAADGEERARASTIIRALERQWTEADFIRRMDLAEKPEPEASVVQRLWPRVAALLTSQGFTRDSGMFAKACSHAGTAIMCLSLVGIAGSQLDANIDARIAHAWDLKVAASEAEAKQSWDRVLNEHKRDEKNEQIEPRRVQIITRAFARAYLSSPAWWTTENALRNALRQERAIEAAAVRERIVKTHSVLLKLVAQTTSDPQDLLLAAAREAALEPTRPTELERRLGAKLVNDLSRPVSGAWEKLSAKVTSFTGAYDMPAKPSDFLEVMVGKILDPTFDALQPEVSAAATKELEKVVNKGLKTAVQRSINTQFDRFLVDLAGDATLPEALSKVAAAPPDRAAFTPREVMAVNAFSQFVNRESTRVAAQVANVHPGFSRPDQMPTNVDEVRRLAVVVNENQRRSWKLGLERTSQPAMDFLASYDDYFANSTSSAASTFRAKILANAGYRLTPKQFSDAASRARNFDKLTVFNRVGGVLIGRGADETSSGLDGFGLRLELSADNTRYLLLRHVSGEEIRLGPYLPDVIYRALLFAADGRPLVVTILNTGLRGVQKVILHPTLIDSAVGCEMIELDKFAFSYVSDNLRTTETSEMRRVARYDALYLLASLHGSRALVKPEYKADFDQRIKTHIELSTPQALQAALVDPLLFSDPKQSPLAARYRIYAAPILDSMNVCSPPRATTLDAFGDCIESEAATRTGSNRDAELWRRLPKPLEFVSGVRDRRFSLDRKLSFLRRHAEMTKPSILQFLIQDTDGGGDPNVWTFETLAPSIEKGVMDLVQTSNVAKLIFTNAEDFAALQRLFRVIFEGQLRGDELLRQVADLADQLRPQLSDDVTTSRWNTAVLSQGMDEARSIAALHDQLVEAFVPAKLESPEVVTALATLAQCGQVATKSQEGFISAAAWQANCSLATVREPLVAACREAGPGGDAAACRLAAAADFSEETLSEIKLRELIGVPMIGSAAIKAPRTCRAGL